jgi:hypothetical protein
MPGYPVDKNQLDMIMGTLSRQIDQWAPDTLKIKQDLDGLSEADLTAPPFSYTADDVALIKSAFNDLALLANIYLGKDVITEARDLGTFSRRLAGLWI